METLGDRITKIRGTLTMQQFAEKLSGNGVVFDKGNISKYEKGIVNPSFNFFVALSKNFNIDLNWFITGEGEMHVTRTKGLKHENDELKRENEAVKKMVAIEVIKYLENHFLTGKAGKKPGKKRMKK